MDTVLDTPYAGETVLQIVLVTGLLGGGAAWLSGRAIAATWRPAGHAIVAMLLIGAAVRFIHFALFEGTLLSLTSYACDMFIFITFGLLAWRATRAAQMVRQYPWLYARAGPLRWRKFEQP
jgi:uncharacterized protein DUF6867